MYRKFHKLRVRFAELEKLLRVVERFKCRCFVSGSIKHYELVED